MMEAAILGAKTLSPSPIVREGGNLANLRKTRAQCASAQHCEMRGSPDGFTL